MEEVILVEAVLQTQSEWSIFLLFCSVLCYYFFKRHCLCTVSQKTLIQAVCALCTHPFSHTIYTHSNPTLLLSLEAWHKGDCSFPTHHLKREKMKKTQRDFSIFSAVKLILSLLPFCVRLQWGAMAHLAFASFLHPFADGLCACIDCCSVMSAHTVFVLLLVCVYATVHLL